MRWFRRSRPETIAAESVATIVDRDVALAATLADVERERLLALTTEIVDTKRWEATDGIELTDDVLVTIAANAAIPILALDTGWYGNVHAIIVHSGSRESRGPRSGPGGALVSDGPSRTIGETAPHAGPVAISWDAAFAESRRPRTGRNVVIHEFAHKIDMRDGYTDGVPPMRGDDLAHWSDVLADEYERADGRPSDVVLRPYAWSNAAEFFAVATEAFFCTPAKVRKGKPELYGALADFYRQDPAGRV